MLLQRQSRVLTAKISEKLFALLSVFCGLTPELSRTAARHGGVVKPATQAEPRSGLGLNELLDLRAFAHSYTGHIRCQRPLPTFRWSPASTLSKTEQSACRS